MFKNSNTIKCLQKKESFLKASTKWNDLASSRRRPVTDGSNPSFLTPTRNKKVDLASYLGHFWEGEGGVRECCAPSLGPRFGTTLWLCTAGVSSVDVDILLWGQIGKLGINFIFIVWADFSLLYLGLSFCRIACSVKSKIYGHNF